MASNQRFSRAYGLDTALQNLAPRPVVSQRAPLVTDRLQIGTTWVDVPNQSVYVLVAIDANSAVWTTSPASGVGAFTSATINPGNLTVTVGDVLISAGTLSVTLGNTTLGGDLTVAGTTTINGDFDLTSIALIDLTSTLNASPSILLHANGGTSEQIQLHSDQGTSTESIYLLSDVGGVTLYAINSTSAFAIELQADAGGIHLVCAKDMLLTCVENAADAIVLNATFGGIDITSGGAAGQDIDITASSSINITSTEDVPGCIYLHANAGTSETILLNAAQGTGVDSINIVSTAGGVTVNSGLASADAINLEATAGGVDIDGALQVNIASSQNAASAIVISASAGGIDITSAGAAGEDIDITASSSINITSTEDAAECIAIQANAGTTETISILSAQGTAVDSIDIASTSGGITVNSGLASADAINIEATAGGIDIDGVLQVNIASSQNAASAIVISAPNGGIDLISGGGAGEDIDLFTSSSVNLTSTEAAADAIVIFSSDAAGGIDLTTGGGSIDISSAGFVTMTAETDAQASPTAASTLNVNVGTITFTGFTTASGATEVFTITNAIATTASRIFTSACNEGGNDAQMTVTRVKRAAGSFEVTLTNNGAAALNGDITINFWIIG